MIRQRKKADQTEAISNARQIGLALDEFMTEYGKYPDDSTAAAVADATESEKVTGTTANARFRQLIRAGIVQSEHQFHVRTPGSRRADNLMDGNHALVAGECGFGYIGNVLTADQAPRPIVMAPFVKGTDRFDPTCFDGKAVILWTDMSVRSMVIDRSSGQVMLDGRNLLDPNHPIWGGQPPVIALPE